MDEATPRWTILIGKGALVRVPFALLQIIHTHRDVAHPIRIGVPAGLDGVVVPTRHPGRHSVLIVGIRPATLCIGRGRTEGALGPSTATDGLVRIHRDIQHDGPSRNLAQRHVAGPVIHESPVRHGDTGDSRVTHGAGLVGDGQGRATTTGSSLCVPVCPVVGQDIPISRGLRLVSINVAEVINRANSTNRTESHAASTIGLEGITGVHSSRSQVLDRDLIRPSVRMAGGMGERGRSLLHVERRLDFLKRVLNIGRGDDAANVHDVNAFSRVGRGGVSLVRGQSARDISIEVGTPCAGAVRLVDDVVVRTRVQRINSRCTSSRP